VTSRREQLEAYRFVTRRIGSAVLFGEPETNELPMRRLGLSTFGSVMIAVLAVAVVGVIGFINPSGNASWKNSQSITIEKETGTRLYYHDGRLSPILNFSSALLIVGQASPPINSVSRNSLADVPRGAAYGIVGAPDLLPSQQQLVKDPWSVCAGTIVQPTGQKLYVGVSVGGAINGDPLGTKGLLVQPTGSQDVYLLWNNHRLRINDPAVARASLGWATASVVQVGPAFLNAVTAGPDLARPSIDGAGQPGPAIAGRSTKIGDVVELNNTPQYFVVLSDGLSVLPETAAKLLLAGSQPVQLDPQAYASAPRSTRPSVVPSGYPLGSIPELAAMNAPTSTVCASLSGASGTDVTLSTLSETPSTFTDTDRSVPPSTGTPSEPTADRVSVPGGHGAVVRDVPSPGVTTGTLYLVTDSGIRFPVASTTDLAALGYSGVDPTPISTNILNLLPTGPTLSVANARKAVVSTSDR
jgi:type VII secretion protein EccB